MDPRPKGAQPAAPQAIPKQAPPQRQPQRRAVPAPLPTLPSNAPLEARAIASLLQWEHYDREREKPDDLFIALSRLASVDARRPLALLPEVKTLFELQQALPSPLQGFRSQALSAAISSDGLLIEYPYEAMTPVLQSKVSFADALKIADHPGLWATSTPQMRTIDDHALPPNGSLWRWSLTKRTDFGVPLLNGLVAQETIHIKAEGSTSADGKRGHRRYSHVLAATAADPDLLRVVKDTGWIELSGDESGIELRVKKEASILRPPDDPLAAIISAGFTAELWFWAMGFFEAAGADSRPQLRLPLKPLPQRPQIITPPPAPAPFHVAVLGAGPAGLACAWLLSNPRSAKTNEPAWSPKNGGNLPLKVTLVEKSCIPGGKAASGRRSDTEKDRVEEHGLHVLMGCYSNVLEMIRWANKGIGLREFGQTLLPGVGATALDGMWRVELGAWPEAKAVESLAEWGNQAPLNGGWETLLNVPRERLDEDLPMVLQLGEAAKESRPILRSFAEMGKRILALRPKPTALPRTTQGLHMMMAQWFTVRMMTAEVRKTSFLMAGAPAPEPSNLSAMASLLREFARTALPADSEDEDIAMLREWVELATTVVVGLEAEGLFPYWALNNPKKLLTVDYAMWVRGIQELDVSTLRDWLEFHGIAAGFVPNSRVLAALTASVFTTTEGIAAGTFLHGMARLLLTYEGAPYRRMVGGTGEAFVAPVFAFLHGKPSTEFEWLPGTDVEALEPGLGGRIVSASICKKFQCDAGNFSAGPTPGFLAPPKKVEVTEQPTSLPADAFVLAIPPYGCLPPGIPSELAASLGRIHHRATIGLQSWTGGAPHYPDAIISAMPGPLRCAAAMSELNEGPNFNVPIYACGDVDDTVADAWCANNDPRDAWLATYRPMLQQGAPSSHTPHKTVNNHGSERYTCADVDTQAARRLVYDTGVLNLWLAGDWTRTALSCGSIEAAVTSGLEAARDILERLDCDVHFPIIGAISKE